MAEQVFMPTGEVWLMRNTDTQFAVVGREEAKGQRKYFYV